MINIKTLIGVACLLMLLIILFHPSVAILEDRAGKKAKLEVFQVDNGWGYQIVKGDKRLIYQPAIPAIDAVMPFSDKISASEVGSLVLKRFNAGCDFSVSQDEVIQRVTIYTRHSIWKWRHSALISPVE